MKFTDTTHMAEVISDLNAEVPRLVHDLVADPQGSSAWVGGAIYFGFLENA